MPNVIFVVIVPVDGGDRSPGEMEAELRLDLAGLEASGRWRIEKVACVDA